MKKLMLLVITTCAFFGIAKAQTIDFSLLGKATKADSIAKKIVDHAQFLVIYDYEYAPDPNVPADKRKGLTMLQVGQRYNRFMDYNAFRFDSLMDATAKGLVPLTESGPLMLPLLKKRKFTENIVIDKEKNTEIVQRTAGLRQRYQYDELCPTLNWTLAEGDTLIAGYICKKATTSLCGRDYIAWYAPEVDLPYGPYKFSGLPGLIFKIVDTNDNFRFTLSGLEKVSQHSPIYLWANKDMIKTKRDKVRKIYKNYCADPVGALTSNGDIMVSDDVKATVNAKPYNPMELE